MSRVLAVTAATALVMLAAAPALSEALPDLTKESTPACSVSQAKFARYARRVYSRAVINRHAKARMRALVSCQSSARARRNVRILRRHLKARWEARSTPEGFARWLLGRRGWAGQWGCLYALWSRESKWSVTAHNASGAHGIPQALPGSKMGPGWESNPFVQIRWGIGYIAGRYGSPCNANAAQAAQGWY